MDGGMFMIVYLGAVSKVDHINLETIVQNLSNDTDSIGIWLTSDITLAKFNAKGTETVFVESETEYWDDGEPKVVQIDRPVNGFIYKIYMSEPNLKIYESNTEDSYDLFMRERDLFCDYFSANKRNVTWKNHAILLNKAEANAKFRKSLISQGYEGLLIRNSALQSGVTDQYCLFSESSLHISDVIAVDELDN
jgi:hypothetical protein